jgi:hypothetical protein
MSKMVVHMSKPEGTTTQGRKEQREADNSRYPGFELLEGSDICAIENKNSRVHGWQ